MKERTGDLWVAGNPQMTRIHVEAEKVARFDVPVLMLGETGVGKEVIARHIHRLSSRSHRPFVKINTPALPSALLESELFGYEAGAFTGALRAKPGRVEQAEGGTVFFDEIGEMPADLQAKLLHFLQDYEFCRLGGVRTLRVNVRVIAATNLELKNALADGRLRKDLYYRLGAFTLRIPPLRERPDEIPLLLEHFLERHAAQMDCPVRPVLQRTLDACLQYSWPGNVRELENFAKRLLVLEDDVLALAQLHEASRGQGKPDAPLDVPPGDLRSALRDGKATAERRAIESALAAAYWRRKGAAEILGISTRALHYKMRQYGIVAPIPGSRAGALSALAGKHAAKPAEGEFPEAGDRAAEPAHVVACP